MSALTEYWDTASSWKNDTGSIAIAYFNATKMICKTHSETIAATCAKATSEFWLLEHPTELVPGWMCWNEAQMRWWTSFRDALPFYKIEDCLWDLQRSWREKTRRLQETYLDDKVNVKCLEDYREPRQRQEGKYDDTPDSIISVSVLCKRKPLFPSPNWKFLLAKRLLPPHCSVVSHLLRWMPSTETTAKSDT